MHGKGGGGVPVFLENVYAFGFSIQLLPAQPLMVMDNSSTESSKDTPSQSYT